MIKYNPKWRDRLSKIKTVKQAAWCSFMKWHPSRRSKRGGNAWRDCGLCTMYYDNGLGCFDCPLKKSWKRECGEKESPFFVWYLGTKPDNVNNCDIDILADIIFNDLVEIWEKV